MSAGDSDKTKPRKQFLNVVYFIDSSRTRTMKMPLARVHLFLFCALILLAWSASSLVIIAVLMKDRTDLIANLRQSMHTVFEFESLYDGVYETAYPSGKNQPGKSSKQPQALTTASVSSQASPVSPAPAAQASATAVATEGASAGGEEKNKEATSKKQAVEVVVSNPVVKTATDRLNLTFDLTNKDPKGKSEGYLWATAEFKTDTGQTHILKAPAAIDVNGKGEIEDHKRASYFAIRRFKRNEFQFQLMKGHPGTVVGVKIGISDKPGDTRMIYDVPLGIKVGNLDTESNKKPAAQKGGQG